MRSCDGRAAWALVLALVLLLGAASAARAQESVAFELMVSHVSSEPGSIDPRGAELDRHLRREIRYQSLRVLEVRRLALRLDEIGSVKLPNGRRLRLRPLDLGPGGVLVAVDLEGSMKTDLRIPNGKLVVLGPGEPYEGGRLVISLEPRF